MSCEKKFSLKRTFFLSDVAAVVVAAVGVVGVVVGVVAAAAVPDSSRIPPKLSKNSLSFVTKYKLEL